LRGHGPEEQQVVESALNLIREEAALQVCGGSSSSSSSSSSRVGGVVVVVVVVVVVIVVLVVVIVVLVVVVLVVVVVVVGIRGRKLSIASFFLFLLGSHCPLLTNHSSSLLPPCRPRRMPARVIMWWTCSMTVLSASS